MLPGIKKNRENIRSRSEVVFQRNPKDYKTDLDLTEEEYNLAMVERPKGIYKEVAIKLRALEAKANKTIEEIGIFTF